MADVLLTHSYHLHHDRKQVRKMQPYPPLGTLYAAALLRDKGYSVAVFDSMLESPENSFAGVLARVRPRVVVVYEDNFNFVTKMCLSRMRQTAFDLIDCARKAGATVLVNGSDATDHSGEYLDHGADYIMLGEAEWTLLELVETLVGQSDREIAGINGLTYADPGHSSPIRTPPRSLMKDLDLLPVPSRDLVNVRAYRTAWKNSHGFFALNLIASRGCPYKCNWCAKPIYGNAFNVRSPASVAAEMRELRDRYDADYLWFADDLFGIRPEWLESLADHVERARAVVPFKMQSRVDLMEEGSVKALRRSGCNEAWMGVESGSQKILDAMDKGTFVSQVGNASERLKAHGIRSCFFIQLGYPGETWVEIEKTIQLVRDTQPDDIGVSVAYPIPGTEFHASVNEQLGTKTNWVDSEDLSMMFQGAYTSEFYRTLHDALHAEVESWRAPERSRFRMQESSPSGADPGRLGELWDTVYRLEETCRNPDRTEIAQWTCS